jgi:hypothetical protein
LNGKLNDAARAANLLLDKGVAVWRVDRATGSAQIGDFVVDAGAPEALVSSTARATGVDFAALNDDVSSSAHALKRMRIAMYERYGGGNSDQGWTQFTLEQFGFPYADIKDAELKAGGLNAKYDVIILPADNAGTLVGRGAAPAGGAAAAPGGAAGGRGGGGGGFGGPATPPEYRSGFGDEGVAALKAFVQAGGTLLTFGESGSLAIDRFALPIKDVVAGKTSKEFWSPGSTFHVKVDNTNPLGYGMPANALATWLSGSQAYDITDANAKVETIVTLVDKDVLQSGWLNGEAIIARKAAMVSVPYGAGRVVLIGFRAQHRAQTHGTYKLVFNALLK